jgi:hypothetical protein
MELYAGWSVDDAKVWIKQNNLTKADVRLVDRKGQIIVIAKREWKNA